MKSCENGQLEDPIMKDRIVIGINEDGTRRKLLQVRKLDLAMAVDACRANETASCLLREMRNSEEVYAPRRDQYHGEGQSQRQDASERQKYHFSSSSICKNNKRSRKSCKMLNAEEYDSKREGIFTFLANRK